MAYVLASRSSCGKLPAYSPLAISKTIKQKLLLDRYLNRRKFRTAKALVSINHSITRTTPKQIWKVSGKELKNLR